MNEIVMISVGVSLGLKVEVKTEEKKAPVQLKQTIYPSLQLATYSCAIEMQLRS